MKNTGLLTFTDNAGLENDVHYHDVASLDNLAAFADAIQLWTHSTISYYAFTRGVHRSQAPASSGETDSVSQYLKIFMRDLTDGENFYDFLPAPVGNIMEIQRGGKRMVQDIGNMYAEFVGTMRGHTVEFKSAYLVGYKY